MSEFREKYLKYKIKYLTLKNQLGGKCDCGLADSNENCPRCGKKPKSAPMVASAASQSRTFRVHLMSGDEAEFKVDSTKTILYLKYMITAHPKLGNPPVTRQRLVLMPEYGGREPHEILEDDRVLAQLPHSYDDTVLELVVAEEIPKITGPVLRQILQLIKERNVPELTTLLASQEGYLNLNYQNLKPDDFLQLTNALFQNTSVISIDLAFNQIGESTDLLIPLLTQNTSITNINLSNNRLRNAGAISLAEALKQNNSLTSIDLSYNTIGDAGAISLAEALKQNNSLTRINLNNNMFAYPGAISLAGALRQNTSITEISFSGNDLSRKARVELEAVQATRPLLEIKF